MLKAFKGVGPRRIEPNPRSKRSLDLRTRDRDREGELATKRRGALPSRRAAECRARRDHRRQTAVLTDCGGPINKTVDSDFDGTRPLFRFMSLRHGLQLLLAGWVCASAAEPPGLPLRAVAGEVDFNRDVRPILADTASSVTASTTRRARAGGGSTPRGGARGSRRRDARSSRAILPASDLHLADPLDRPGRGRCRRRRPARS